MSVYEGGGDRRGTGFSRDGDLGLWALVDIPSYGFGRVGCGASCIGSLGAVRSFKAIFSSLSHICLPIPILVPPSHPTFNKFIATSASHPISPSPPFLQRSKSKQLGPHLSPPLLFPPNPIKIKDRIHETSAPVPSSRVPTDRRRR